MKLKLFLYTLLFTAQSNATEIQPFEATYEVIRGGKVTGKQTTLVEKLSGDKWIIKDSIIGTSGMASLIGFKRTETTEFIYQGNEIFATHHEMFQKAAFNKKSYTFDWQPTKSNYVIKHKDQNHWLDTQGKPVISSQLMPMVLAQAACRQQDTVNLLVLKSTKVKPYQFNISHQKTLIAERVYNDQQTKASKTTLDPQRQCLPIEQSHQDNSKPLIVTRLINFKWL